MLIPVRSKIVNSGLKILDGKKSILIARIPTNFKRFVHIKVIRSNKNNILMITAEYLFNNI